MALNIHEIRRRNFNLMREKFALKEDRAGIGEFGRQARMAAFLGLHTTYLSNIVTKRKEIGHNIARQLEAAFKLPTGWMDTDHTAGVDPRNQREEAFAAMALRMFRASPVDAQQMMMQALAEQFVPKQEPQAA